MLPRTMIERRLAGDNTRSNIKMFVPVTNFRFHPFVGVSSSFAILSPVLRCLSKQEFLVLVRKATMGKLKNMVMRTKMGLVSVSST
jgi:hypothetical protein